MSEHTLESLYKKKKNKQIQSNRTFATCLSPCLFVFSYAFPIRFVYLFVFFYVPFLYILSSWLFVTLFVFWRAFPLRFVYLFVCLFSKCLSYTFCLAVRFNCIKRAVFKPLIFPAYSTNIVIVIFHKWPPLISDIGHPFAVHGLPFLLFLPVLTRCHP